MSGVRGGEQTLQQACSQEYPGSARCVQSFDDSLDSAIRITYRISLRSSSMWEPRHPSLKVVLDFRLSAAQACIFLKRIQTTLNTRLWVSQSRGGGRFKLFGFNFEFGCVSLSNERKRNGARGCMSLRTFEFVFRMILPQVHLR